MIVYSGLGALHTPEIDAALTAKLVQDEWGAIETTPSCLACHIPFGSPTCMFGSPSVFAAPALGVSH